MPQTIDDVQQEINALFDRLDVADTGGQINQINNALRLKISRKRQLGGTLEEREKTVISMMKGEVDAMPSKGSPLVTVVIIAVLAVVAYIAYRIMVKG